MHQMWHGLCSTTRSQWHQPNTPLTFPCIHRLRDRERNKSKLSNANVLILLTLISKTSAWEWKRTRFNQRKKELRRFESTRTCSYMVMMNDGRFLKSWKWIIFVNDDNKYVPNTNKWRNDIMLQHSLAFQQHIYIRPLFLCHFRFDKY